jgi:AcrR family transcriptional regulator
MTTDHRREQTTHEGRGSYTAKAASEVKSETGPLIPLTARGEATKRRILDAAEAVFGEVGYYEASVSEITRRAGVAQGTFYIYYHTKREIFAELVMDLSRRLREAMRQAIADAPSRIETERRGFTAFFWFVTQHRRIYRIVQEAERVAPEAAQGYYESISKGYERALRSAMEAGQFREMDPETVAYALMGIGHFLALRWIVWPEEETAPDQELRLPERVFASMLEFIARGLLPSRDT